MMARPLSRISQCQRTHAPMGVRIKHLESRFDVGRDRTQTGGSQTGGSIVRSRILLVGLVLTPAALVATGYSSHGEAKGDDCKAKPDSSSPAGMHWYYRVDRGNNRHCWYLHEQGMRVHSQIESRSRPAETQDDEIDESNRDAAPITAVPQPQRA